MRFQFKLRITVICLVLAIGMLRLSYWQWERHLGKLDYIAEMEGRMKEEVTPLVGSLAALKTDPESMIYRRLAVSGELDFDREMVLRNRRVNDEPGVFLLTPMKIDGVDDARVIVNRGFVPLRHAKREDRKIFRDDPRRSFVALVKEGGTRRTLAPRDPEAGEGKQWVDAWLRVDIENMQKQLPYPVLPVYLEIMADNDPDAAREKIVKSSSGREELLFLGLRNDHLTRSREDLLAEYPIPAYDTVIPPGRHLGYVFEWAAMALATVLIGLVLQLRRPTQAHPSHAVS